MGSLAIPVLALAALITATVSGIIGMGGGILLLAVLFSFLPHQDAIPVHALVQLASNGTRLLAFLGNVDWPTIGRFTLGAVPGAAIGGLLLWLLGSPDQSEPYLKMAVGVYIVLSLVVPLRLAKNGQGGGRTFTLVGLVAGAAALTLGAIGPLIAPVFARHGFVKERLIATKAVCQAIMHLLKLPAFLVLRDLDVQRLGLLAVVMVVMVIPGTLLGKRLLQYVSEQHFILLYRAALLLAAGKLVLIDGVWKVWNGG